ncbi:MAG: 30S ribosomal protein S15 [Patescibacteria group bacterium]
MMLTAKKKQSIVEKFKTHEKDTGSPEVQIALLTVEINELARHLKKNPKDFHSRRGLLKMVAERRSLMSYLSRKSEKRYNSLINKLKIKKGKNNVFDI